MQARARDHPSGLHAAERSHLGGERGLERGQLLPGLGLGLGLGVGLGLASSAASSY